MQPKGYLLASGKVVQSDAPDIVGEVFYKETRYNLRRVLVTREWIIILKDGRRADSTWSRGDAISRALALLATPSPGGGSGSTLPS